MRAMLKEVCAGLPKEELELRITMAIDTMLQTLSNAGFMSKEWTSERDKKGLRKFATRLKAFLAGGLVAPPASEQ